MKSSFVTLAVVVGLATAQVDLGGIPSCANSCVTSYVSGTNIAGCKPADIACVCRNKDFISGISCCLEKVCSKSDVDATIKFASGICAAAGVDTPKSLVCPTGTAGAATKTDSSSTGSSTGTGAATTGSQQTSGSGTATAATTAATSTSTGAAAPVYGTAGGILGAALALVAAL